MEKYARITGYASALAILLAALALVMSLREGVLFPHHRVRVRFPSIGTLMEDDPVKLRGVTVGRVASIEAENGEAIATLEFFHRTPLPADSRFVNYNYSLFGARMVILVAGSSAEAMDAARLQQGDFSSGVSETIHRVDELLRTVSEYKRLSMRLDRGSDTSLSVQQFLAGRVYPVLERFGALVRDMDTLQNAAGAQLDGLETAAAGMDRLGRGLSSQSDTLVARAERTLDRLARLTAQSTIVLHSLEEVALVCQDTTHGPGRLVANRELYDKTMAVTHAMENMLNLLEKDGLTDAIHFWRNVHVNWKKPSN